MRERSSLILVAMVALSCGVVCAEDEPVVKVTQLTDTLYQLTTDQGAYTTTTLASVGPDGVLLVDTQAEGDAEELKKVVGGFGKGAPKIIINTHRHVEHVGGNALWGEEPVIIAHALVPTKLRSGSYLFEEFPTAALPDITLSESLSVFFNGEEIRLIAMPGSHDDNEIIVHFTGSKVVHLSSLVNGFNFPSVDSDGDVLRFAELAQRAIELLPEDVTLVSGHNRNGTIDDLRAYHEMLVATTDVVRAGLAAGKDADTLKQEKVLERWESYAGSYVSSDKWIDYLVKGLEGKERKPTVFEPLYHALKDDGVEAAVALYRQLKGEHEDEYTFHDVDLLIIGDKLLGKGKTGAALAFLELSLEEYPESNYAYYTNYKVAMAYDALGDTDRAIRACEAALELSPNNDSIQALLKELQAKR